MKKYILAIDQGTSSSRALIFDKNVKIISIAQLEVTSYYPEVGWVEQDPQEILNSVLIVVRKALQQASLTIEDIASIGITNQRETTIVWEKATGTPVYQALVWQSRQTVDICSEMIKAGYSDMIKNKTGLLIDAYFSASKIRWILDAIPQGQERAENGELLFGTIDTWLVYNLTAEKVHITDVSNASRTLLMDIHTLQWSKELLNIWNIPASMLPKICDTSCVYGYTSKAIFKAEVPIASVVGDQQAALFGQTCFKTGDTKNTYGTGCFILMNIGDKPVLSKHNLLTTVGWKIKDEVIYALEGSVFVAGSAVKWLRDEMQIIESSSESESKALSVRDNGGVYLVPSFVGLGAPYWDSEVKGAIFGLTYGTQQAHIVRAVLESLCYQSYDVLKAMESDVGFELAELMVDGGASENNFLLKWQANVLSKKVSRPQILETTALGAAFLAGLAVDYWKDKEDIKSRNNIGKVFFPEKNKAEMAHYLKNWKKAIEATKTFK